MIRIGLFFFMLLSLLVAGCSDLNEPTKPQPQPPTEQKAAVLLDRYELKDIRNGTFVGTALLDKQTGRIWTLATSSKGGSVTSLSFDEAYVLPLPGMQPCPPNDPAGLFQAQSCSPSPTPKKGEVK